ncbi:[Fe-Fe] hydrogenase large subunit C-terminal domain-containing protein, partial [Oscillibacter sp.]
ECRKMLTLAKAGKRDGYLLEGMACPGGCVAGAGTIAPVRETAAAVQRYKDGAAIQNALDSPLKERLGDTKE